MPVTWTDKKGSQTKSQTSGIEMQACNTQTPIIHENRARFLELKDLQIDLEVCDHMIECLREDWSPCT